MNSLYVFDCELSFPTPVICGIDEAGRGCLAGPVFAGAVVLDYSKPISGLNDSKKIPEKKRSLVFKEIVSTAIDYAVAYATVEEIERLNILNASMLAMRRAYDALKIKPSLTLIDGNCVRGFDDITTQNIVGGDSKSAAVAAGSILAKVSRDRYMAEMDKKYPGYGFQIHKGYGTKAHIEQILSLGPCPLHRMSFLRNIMKRV